MMCCIVVFEYKGVSIGNECPIQNLIYLMVGKKTATKSRKSSQQYRKVLLNCLIKNTDYSGNLSSRKI